MLNAIKKKDDNNLIDLTLFNEVTRLDNNNDTHDWNANTREKSNESKTRRNLSKSFNNDNDGGKVRHSVLEAFDPLLESTHAKLTLVEDIESGKFIVLLGRKYTISLFNDLVYLKTRVIEIQHHYDP